MAILETESGTWYVDNVSGPEHFRSHMSSLGFVRNAEVKISRKGFFGWIVRIKGTDVAIGPEAASMVEVRA